MLKFYKTLLVRLAGIVSFSILGVQVVWVTTCEGQAPQGAVVEAVSKGSAAEKGGIQVGDVILSWSRARRLPQIRRRQEA